MTRQKAKGLIGKRKKIKKNCFFVFTLLLLVPFRIFFAPKGFFYPLRIACNGRVKASGNKYYIISIICLFKTRTIIKRIRGSAH